MSEEIAISHVLYFPGEIVIPTCVHTFDHSLVFACVCTTPNEFHQVRHIVKFGLTFVFLVAEFAKKQTLFMRKPARTLS